VEKPFLSYSPSLLTVYLERDLRLRSREIALFFPPPKLEISFPFGLRREGSPFFLHLLEGPFHPHSEKTVEALWQTPLSMDLYRYFTQQDFRIHSPFSLEFNSRTRRF